jgi:hypothetical protein
LNRGDSEVKSFIQTLVKFLIAFESQSFEFEVFAGDFRAKHFENTRVHGQPHAVFEKNFALGLDRDAIFTEQSCNGLVPIVLVLSELTEVLVFTIVSNDLWHV